MSAGYESLIPALLRHDFMMAAIVLICGLMGVAVVWAGGHNRQITLWALWPGVVWPRLPGLLLILLIAALVRVPGLFQDFWYDESVTAHFAGLDWSQLGPAIAQDTHPPLHYLMVWAWAQIGGNSALWLRLPELGFSLLSVLLIYRVARALMLNKRETQIAALVVALLPAAVYFGVELRSYALLSCLSLGMLLSILRNRAGWFVAICALICLTHHYGLFYSVLGAFAALLYWRSARWFAAGAAVAVGLLLWLPMVVAQAAAVSDGFWVNSPGAVVTSFVEMLMKPPNEYRIVLIGFGAELVFASLYLSRRWLISRGGLLWAALLFGVPALAVVVSYLFTPVYEARYIYPSAILLAIPIAMAVSRSQLAALAALALLLVGIAAGYSHPRTPFAALARTHCAQADAYFHLSLEAAFTLTQAAPGAVHIVTPGAADQIDVFTAGDAQTLGFDVGDLPAGRVCVMSIDSPATSQNERFWIAWLTGRYPFTVGAFADRGFNYVFYQFEVQ